MSWSLRILPVVVPSHDIIALRNTKRGMEKEEGAAGHGRVLQKDWTHESFVYGRTFHTLNSWIWIHESDFTSFFLEKRPWKRFLQML